MAVSPADFEFYSRVTGIPIPNDPVARMRMAPQVYAMRRSPMSKLGSFAKGAAKALGTAALLGGAAAIGGAIGGAGGGAVGGAVGGAGGGFAGGFTGSQYGNDYEPEQSSTPEEPVETVKVEVDAAPTPSAREKAEDLVHAYRGSVPTAPRNEPEVEVTGNPVSSAVAAGFGSIEEARSSLQAKYGQRLSHQTEVPQADPNLANESFDAQRASVGEPVESLTTGMPAQAAPGVETAVAQAYEFFEGSPGKSPFQAGGAMNELGRQSRQVKQTVGDLPPQLASEVARFISNYRGNPVASEPEVSVDAPAQGFTQKEANSRIVSLMKEGIEQLEGGKPSIEFEPGQSSKYKSMTLDPSGDIDVVFRKTPNTTYNYSVDPEASAAFEQIANIPDEAGSAQRDPAFVTDKGMQVGDILARAQEKKESKVTLGDIGQAALGVVKSVVTGKSAKRAARSAELDRTLAKGLGNLSPEQRAEQRDKILRKEGY